MIPDLGWRLALSICTFIYHNILVSCYFLFQIKWIWFLVCISEFIYNFFHLLLHLFQFSGIALLFSFHFLYFLLSLVTFVLLHNFLGYLDRWQWSPVIILPYIQYIFSAPNLWYLVFSHLPTIRLLFNVISVSIILLK